jgi:hypothetical protein
MQTKQTCKSANVVQERERERRHHRIDTWGKRDGHTDKNMDETNRKRRKGVWSHVQICLHDVLFFALANGRRAS